MCAPGRRRHYAATGAQQFFAERKNVRRKLLEIFLAQRIEDKFSKQKILELYLNRIYFGGGLYGAEAASRGSLANPAREMSLAECAMLAGLIKSPNRLSPWADRATSREARDYALDRMRRVRYQAENNALTREAREIVVGSRQNAQGPTSAVDYIRQQVIAAVGWDRAINEGYRIHTTIDVDLQKVAEDSLRASSRSDRAAFRLRSPDLRRLLGLVSQSEGKRRCHLIFPRPSISKAQSSVWTTPRATFWCWSAGAISSATGATARCRRAGPLGPRCCRSFMRLRSRKECIPGRWWKDSPLDNGAVMIGGTTGSLGEIRCPGEQPRTATKAR